MVLSPESCWPKVGRGYLLFLYFCDCIQDLTILSHFPFDLLHPPMADSPLIFLCYKIEIPGLRPPKFLISPTVWLRDLICSSSPFTKVLTLTTDHYQGLVFYDFSLWSAHMIFVQLNVMSSLIIHATWLFLSSSTWSFP